MGKYTNDISDKGLISKIYKKLTQFKYKNNNSKTKCDWKMGREQSLLNPWMSIFLEKCVSATFVVDDVEAVVATNFKF